MKATTDARPVHRVYVDGFFMDKTDVTNAEFAKFVTAVGYITVAERKPRAQDFPGAPPENLVAGSVVFSPPKHPVRLNDHFSGGLIFRALTGDILLGQKATSRGKKIIQWSMSGIRRCRGLCEMGRKTPANRGSVGVCGARRRRWKTVCLGK